jgi:hypothetical protein
MITNMLPKYGIDRLTYLLEHSLGRVHAIEVVDLCRVVSPTKKPSSVTYTDAITFLIFSPLLLAGKQVERLLN